MPLGIHRSSHPAPERRGAERRGPSEGTASETSRTERRQKRPGDETPKRPAATRRPCHATFVHGCSGLLVWGIFWKFRCSEFLEVSQMTNPYDCSLQCVSSKDGTYVFHCEASVELLQLKEEDPSILLVELEQTIFHPQGGRRMAGK